jgi:hypothetical protein
MRKPARLVLVLAAAALCGCISQKEHDRILESASRTCSQDSDCVIAGGLGGCTCPIVVNRQSQKQIDNASRRAFCGGSMVECPDLGTPVCREGACTSRLNQR